MPLQVLQATFRDRTATRRLAALLLLAALATLPSCLGGGGITPVRTAFNRGVYLATRGDLDGAIAEYEEALADDPSDQRARFNLALAAEQRAAELETQGDAARAQELRQRARREYEAVVRSVPDHPRASLNLAALTYEDDPAAGEAQLRALIERRPERVEARAALAAHLLAANRTDEAVALLEAAHREQPASSPVHLLLGDAYRARGETDAARVAYERVLQRDDENLGALSALAELELAAGDAAAAIGYGRRALLIDPDSYRTHLVLSEASAQHGDLERAIVHTWAARRLRPKEADTPETAQRLIGWYEQLLGAERARVDAARQ